MARFLKNNSLSLVLGALFLFALAGQAVSGWLTYNEEQREHAEQVARFGEYLANSHFLGAVFENWESEFLQMALFVALTVFLRQKGSPESKPVDGENAVDKVEITARSPAAARRGGWMLKLYQNSLTLALTALFLFSLIGHLVTSAGQYNADKREHGGVTVTTSEYFLTPRFWYESFQNWQSEFLSIAVLVVFSVYLRQKGSPESKPVGSAHADHE